jgi:hypothetical protein
MAAAKAGKDDNGFAALPSCTNRGRLFGNTLV